MRFDVSSFTLWLNMLGDRLLSRERYFIKYFTIFHFAMYR